LTYLDFLRARNHNEVFALCEDPGEGDLAGRGVVLLAYFGDAIDNALNVGEVLLRVPSG
jgi:hypothetical protein